MNDFLFSICITSYNRVKELRRLLESVDSVKYASQLEIIVSEDKSPKRLEIQKIFNEYAAKSKYETLLNLNESNLGYDNNLRKLINLARGKYIIFMSDDDAFIPKALDLYLDSVLHYDSNLAFQPFVVEKNYYRKYKNSFFIPASEENAAKHILNDAILFSGLTFKKKVVEGIDAKRFINTYYFQVYLFLTVLYKLGAHYIDVPLVYCISDGENGYGLSDSCIKNEDLANRNSIYSKLEFHKGLIRVLSIFDEEHSVDCKRVFSYEYSLRSLPEMCIAKRMGNRVYKEYITRKESLDIKLTWIYWFYKSCIMFLGGNLTQAVFKVPKLILIKMRQNIKR